MGEFEHRTFSPPPGRVGAMVDVALRHVSAAPGARILDVGCGTGHHALALAHALPGAEVVGVDVSVSNIARAEAARRSAPPLEGARVRFAAADYLAFESPPFDVIVADSTFHLIPGPTEDLARKLAHDLRGGGRLILNVPYECVYNRLLWRVRRVFRLLRGRATDGLVLLAGRLLHGASLGDAELRDRLNYMYLLPERFDCAPLRERLASEFGLRVVAEYPSTHASVAQPKHRFVVFERVDTGESPDTA